MPKVSEIESAILRLEGGRYQEMMNAYLFAKYSFDNILTLGSQTGTEKTTKGIPDSYVRLKNGKYIYIMYGTVKTASFNKLKADIESVKNDTRSKIPYTKISRLICCHTSSTITPSQDAELHTLIPNLELIGIATVAHELFLKYQTIARDCLGVKIDTNQILSYSDFIKKYEIKGLSTPLTFPLIGRNTEKSELINIIKDNNVLLISGRSGIGKTRLALEAAKEFAVQNRHTLKCVLNNGENIYDDIIAHFPDTENNLILIDDANLLTHINHFMDMTCNPMRKHKAKVILTVRDYAKRDLISRISDYGSPKTYTLNPLKEEDILKIIKDNFGFTSRELLKKIISISRDNARIAIIAAKCASNKDWDKIHDATGIFDSYYGNTISGLSRKEMIVASFLSFFQRVKISEDHIILDFLKSFKIDYAEFYEIVRSLHQKEIVDVYNDIAIKFSEQTLGDYLLYYAFSKSKIIPTKKLILKTFPKYRKRIVALLEVSIGTFRNQETTDYLVSQLKEAWQDIEKGDKELQLNFIEAFHSLLEDEGLSLILKEIKSLPDTNISFLDFDKKEQGKEESSKLLSILASYKMSDKFETALEILLFYIEHKAQIPRDIYNIFSNQLFIDPHSYPLKYTRELLVIKALEKHYKQSKNINIGVMLAFFAGECLKFKCTHNINHGRSIEMLTIYMEPHKKALELRKRAVKSLSLLCSNKDLKNFVKKIIMEYKSYDFHTAQRSLLKQDLEFLANLCKKHFSYKTFDGCLILRNFYKIAKKNGINLLSKFNLFHKNKLFSIFVVLGRSRLGEGRAYEEVHKEKILEAQKLTSKFTKNDFLLLFANMKSSYLFQIENIFPYGTIETLFESQEYKKEKYFDLFNAYIEQGTPFMRGNMQYSLARASQALGFKTILNLIKNTEFKEKDIFLSSCYEFMPLDLITNDILTEFLSMSKRKISNKNITLLTIRKAMEINTKFAGFAYSYFKTIYTLFSDSPGVVNSFLDCYAMDELDSVKNIVNILSPTEDKQTLQQAYILIASKDHQRNFDYKGYIFKAIYEHNSNFIDNIVAYAIVDLKRSDAFGILDVVWQLDNYKEIIYSTIDSIYKLEKEKRYMIYHYLERLLSFIDRSRNVEKRDIFVKEYLEKYQNNKIRMSDLFNAMTYLSLPKKQEFIIYFCKTNPSFDIFKEIRLHLGSRSWSGSQVPVIEREINGFKEMQNLLNRSKYLEHRTLIEKRISQLEREKREVITQEFLEEDDW